MSHSESAPEFARWPVFEAEEIEAATAALRSGRVNYWGGQEGIRFEHEFATFVQAKYGVATANGTLALELALHALGLAPGDEVIVPARTYIATAAAVVRHGARPVCADVDIGSGNVTAETIAAQITPRTRGVIAVHMAGWPCRMDEICALTEQADLFLVEDCAQAHGARYLGRPVGSFGDAAAFSFCQDKILTTAGEGGMLTTNQEDVFRTAWRYKDHGRDASLRHDEAERRVPVSFEYVVESFGSNLRMTELQAAIGRSSLRKLPSWLETRRRHAGYLAQACRDAGLRVPLPPASSQHAYYRLHAYIDPSRLSFGWTRDRILQSIRDRGVPCLSGSCFEIYREPAFRDVWPHAQRLANAARLGDTSIAFLVHPTLSDEAIAYAGDVVRGVMREAFGSWAPCVERGVEIEPAPVPESSHPVELPKAA